HELEENEGEKTLLPAERALNYSLKALRDAGSEAVGEVVEKHPMDLLKSVVEQTRADEVIVLTAPHLVEEFFHRDWTSRARHKVGVPVLKLFAHNDERKEEQRGQDRKKEARKEERGGARKEGDRKEERGE